MGFWLSKGPNLLSLTEKEGDKREDLPAMTNNFSV